MGTLARDGSGRWQKASTLLNRPVSDPIHPLLCASHACRLGLTHRDVNSYLSCFLLHKSAHAVSLKSGQQNASSADSKSPMHSSVPGHSLRYALSAPPPASQVFATGVGTTGSCGRRGSDREVIGVGRPSEEERPRSRNFLMGYEWYVPARMQPRRWRSNTGKCRNSN